MQVNIDLTNIKSCINEHFWPFITDTESSVCVLVGGASSGKSEAVAQKIILRIITGMEKGIKHKFLVLRATQPSARHSVFSLFQDIRARWGLEKISSVNKTNMIIDFLGGSQILCGGLDDVAKLKSITGITSIWLEEASELNLEKFRQISIRMRGDVGTYKMIMMSLNPISKLNWVYKTFIEREHVGATVYNSTYKNNRFLTQEDKDILECLIDQDENYYRVYCLGEWCDLGGTIYSNYTIVKKLPDDVEETIYGCDFGYNAETAIVKICSFDNEYYLDEVLYQTKLTNADLIERIKSLSIKDVIYCDSAEPQRIEELRRAGIYVRPAFKGKNSVKDGIDFCKRSVLHITENSVNLIKEIGGYCYKKDKDDNVLEEPVKFMDHALDAFRYGIYTHWAHKMDLSFVISGE